MILTRTVAPPVALIDDEADARFASWLRQRARVRAMLAAEVGRAPYCGRCNADVPDCVCEVADG